MASTTNQNIQVQAGALPFKNLMRFSDVAVALAVILILVMMIVPLPPFVLDVLLTFNITFSMIILLVTMYTLEPLQFSVFPSLLLIATLFRLALNVSSTRLILLHGFAGRVIGAFGHFVVGGNYVVGMVIFVILVVIQFVVITNGAGRVAEVAARFTLDAMPGKQMSIDADLNAGLINDTEARTRRRAIEQEADFYGAMDGASKFVRGDAIAGIVIIAVNILGGVVIGVLQLKMPIIQALQTYALLTVGDGLVTQIPALLISTATGIVVTRAASESNLGIDLAKQILSQPRAVAIAAGILVVFGMVPGLPKLPFFIIAAGAGTLAYVLDRASRAMPEHVEEKPEEEKAPENVMTLLHIDPLELEIGYGLFALVDPDQGGDLLDRITMVRRQVATEFGLVVPPVRIRDNVQLKTGTYAIKIKGLEVSKGEIVAGRYLAMNPGIAEEPIEGIETREPVFGMPAVWITEADKEHAEMVGYTVVDASSVITTHLAEIIKSHAEELLGRQDVQNLVDNVKAKHPAVVEDLVPNLMAIGDIQKVLQALLRERVSIRDLVTIFETLGDSARIGRDVEFLTESVRKALGRSICKQYQDAEGTLFAITLDPRWEQVISHSIQRTERESYLALEPGQTQVLLSSLSSEVEKAVTMGHPPVLLCSPGIRWHTRRLTERVIPTLAVLSYNEVVPNVKVRSMGMVRMSDAD